MAKKPKVGDVVEIPTGQGFVYAQYSHRHPEWGELIRVLPGRFNSTPESFDRLIQQPARFFVFFPLSAALRERLFEVVTNQPIPEVDSNFPLFRAAGLPDKAGKVHDWWLWDGEREWHVGPLTEDQRNLPKRAVVNLPYLMELIKKGWRGEE